MARPPTDDERATIEFMISLADTGQDELRAQLETASVESFPDDSISLRLLPSDASPPANPMTPLDAKGVDDSGVEVYVILHLWNGRLHELEFYVMGGEDFYGRPRTETLCPAVFNLWPPDDEPRSGVT